MSDTDKTPSVDEIKAQVRKEVESEIRTSLQSQFEEEKTKILGNRDQILEEKRALEQKFKGFDEDKFKGYQDYLKRLETDEEMRLLNEGKIDDVIERRVSGMKKAWNETQAEYEERIKTYQHNADELSGELEATRNKLLDVTKRTYLKDLVGDDDSFRKEYFSDFVDLYGKRVQIDEQSGKVYALDVDGKKMVGPDGEHVSFKDFYTKQKVDHGLFWTGGSGSGYKGQGGQEGAKKFKDMDWREKNALRKEMGDAKYEQFVREQSRKK